MHTLTRKKETYNSLTDKQKEAALLLSEYKHCLLEGGSRSGKTFLACRAIIRRAARQKSDHLITRFRFSHAKQAICYQTFPAAAKSVGLSSQIKLNKTDWFYELPNGSTIWIGGLDDKERTEKILGNEYSTIFENEASQISFDSHETLMTRLNPSGGMRALNIIDYNPPSKHHWGYLIFHKGIFPDGRPVPHELYASIKMNPSDNLQNLSEGYIDEVLGNLSSAKQKRFLHGEYSDDIGKLWKREWIKYKHETPDLQRIVVAVDPTGTKSGDECGIVVAGRIGEEYHVLDDYSLNGTAAEWAAEVAKAYEYWKADAVIAESNYGGDMVKAVINNQAPNARVKLVTATRGKVVRAEPISALYERGKVWHNRVMQDLEDEMCSYDPETSASPNRMDALVWAITDMMPSNKRVFIGRA